MQSTSLRRTVAATALFVSLAAITVADTFSFPHVLEKNGVIVGIAWNPIGGQSAVAGTDAVGGPLLGWRDFEATFSLYDNGVMPRLLCDAINGNVRTETFRVIPVPQSVKNLNLPHNTTVMVSGGSMTLPGCDVESKDTDGLRIIGTHTVITDSSNVAPAFDSNTYRFAAKRQKMWNASAFRLSVNGKALPNVLTVNPIKLSVTSADIDGDGKPDVQVDSSDIVLTLPPTDGADFSDAFKKSQAGQPVPMTVQVDYLDENGVPLLSLTETVVVTSVGPAAVFLSGDPQLPMQVACHKKGLNAVNVKLA